MQEGLPKYALATCADVIPRNAIMSALGELFSSKVEGNLCDELHLLVKADSALLVFSLDLSIDEVISGEATFTVRSSRVSPWSEWAVSEALPGTPEAPQWFHTQGTSARRATCLTGIGPEFCVADLQMPWLNWPATETPSEPTLHELRHANDGTAVTWGLPRSDFDDSLGVFIFGDTFGHITLLDVVEENSLGLVDLVDLMHECVTSDSGTLTLMSKV